MRGRRFCGKQTVNLVLTVLEIVAPVFLLALIGFLWVRLGFEYRIEFVTKLAMTLSVPALIFTALMKTEIEPAALTTLSLAAVAAYGAITLAAWIGTRLAGLDMRTYLAPLIFGNTGNLGLPLALFAFGEAGLGYAVVVFAVMAVWSFTFGVWIVAGGGSPMKALKEPLVWATLLGALFLWQGWQTPRFLTNTLDLIGQIAIPLMLITLGVAVARLHPAGLGRALLLSLVKVAATVAIGWGIGLAFGLADVPFAVLVLQVSTPVAVTSYMLAAKYGADSDAVAGLVVVSTLTAVATIPLTLAFLI
jgi:malate permease and related proteins